MTRRIIYILLGAVILFLLILGLWFWFFGGKSTPPTGTGQLGRSPDKTTNGGGNGSGGNGQTPIGTTNGNNGNNGNTVGTGGTITDNGGVNNQVPIDNGSGNPVGDTTSDTTFYTDTGTSYTYTPPPDVIWNDGTTTGGGVGAANGGNVVFDPSLIRPVNKNRVTGNPFISVVPTADGQGTVRLDYSGYLVAIGGCIAQYELNRIQVAPVAALNSAVDTVISVIFGFLGGGGGLVTDLGTEQNTATETVGQCLVRTLGKLAVQNITDSLVNWINSGFDGKPAFVQDFNKFFSDVGDQAAGTFLQSSDFAFLCSPFSLQVRIAIVQSYARRHNAPSCTLTDVIKNIDSFTSGSFAQGGWKGLLSFNTESANNPFTSFMALSVRMDAKIANAQANAAATIAPGGFKSVMKCPKTPPKDTAVGQNLVGVSQADTSHCEVVTPGQAVLSQFNATTQANLDSLGVGDSIDQILSALKNALITKIFKTDDGLLGAGNTDTADTSDQPKVDPVAQAQATALMKTLRTGVNSAQSYGTVEQRIISDIQDSQSTLNDLRNCWINATTSATLTSTQTDQATAGVSAAVTKISQLQQLVAKRNANIQQANRSIARLQQLQTDLLLATVAADVTRVQNTYNAVVAAGKITIYDKTDITTAQQDRATVQGQLTTIDSQTTTGLAQCNALTSQQ
jgi:hypothetical protein